MCAPERNEHSRASQEYMLRSGRAAFRDSDHTAMSLTRKHVLWLNWQLAAFAVHPIGCNFQELDLVLA